MLKVTGAAPIAAQRWEVGAWSCAAHHDPEPPESAASGSTMSVVHAQDPPFSLLGIVTRSVLSKPLLSAGPSFPQTSHPEEGGGCFFFPA